MDTASLLFVKQRRELNQKSIKKQFILLLITLRELTVTLQIVLHVLVIWNAANHSHDIDIEQTEEFSTANVVIKKISKTKKGAMIHLKRKEEKSVLRITQALVNWSLMKQKKVKCQS